jgi:RimJ/RimL family protein N-acetyltransferase
MRPICEGDLAALLELDSDPEVMRYISGGVPTSPKLGRELLDRMLASATRPGVGFFAVEEGETFCGWMHLRADRFEPSWMELGYRFKRAYWGRGLATSLGRELVERAFGALDCETASARTLPGNRASRRVMEKLGMGFSGEFEYPERVVADEVIPAMPAVLYLRHR